ncbi:MAG TPA: structural protein P5 [Candidatus Alistipes merdigallinarum]|nr:structural protein P5 [Candidatus Alistipes merdigallinarum]
MISRGFRNNNPGNIRHDKDLWRGEITGEDKLFKTFETMAWGIRAMFHLLNNYRVLYGCDTLEKLIGRWAPPVENDTERYLSFVSEQSGVAKNGKIATTEREVMVPVVQAMIRMENGVDVPLKEIEAGWRLFLEYKK